MVSDDGIALLHLGYQVSGIAMASLVPRPETADLGTRLTECTTVLM